jgi:hypothetical protein
MMIFADLHGIPLTATADAGFAGRLGGILARFSVTWNPLVHHL